MARRFDVETAERPDPAPPVMPPQPEPVTNAVGGGYSSDLTETEPPDRALGPNSRAPMVIALVAAAVIVAAIVYSVAF